MTTFTIYQEHLDLLRAMEWEWNDCEFGAPAVDCKRPFGSSSGYHYDMAKAVGWQYDADSQEQEDELMRLYRETMTVLMIGVAVGSFEPGQYVRDADGWMQVFDVI
jgi:hypothetical protein